MAVTESFLVNTNSFNPIIEALIERDEAPEEITDELFASMGFDSPSELLVIHMLKELNMLTVEGKPTELYHELTNPDTTDEALAEGIFHAYTDLFKQNKEFYKLQKEDIYKALEEYFEGRKTELILKYMTNTFHKLVSYAGLNNMQKAVDEHLGGVLFVNSYPIWKPVRNDERYIKLMHQIGIDRGIEVHSRLS